MQTLATLRSRTWTPTIASGVLIVIGLVAQWLAGAPTVGRVAMLAAALVAGTPIATRAWYALRAGTIGIELLVAIAATGAVVIGEYWEAAAVTFLFALGGALEQATLRRTRRALGDLLDLAPTMAMVVRDGRQVEVAAGAVEQGETIVVKAGAKVPVDGTVSRGNAAVDEASITGESIPAEKVVGGRVFAGTVSHDGWLEVTATGIGSDTTLARVIHRVEQAQEEKARAQRLMERFSRWYTPGVILLALVAGVATGDLELALTLLVIGCPGALVISMPVSIVAGIGRAARLGILVKGGDHLETAGRVTTVAVDKTGTLTRGRPVVTDVVALADEPAQDLADSPAGDSPAGDSPAGTTGDQMSADQVLAWAASAEAGSGHPLAAAVVEAAVAADIALAPVEHVESVAGRGIIADVAGHRVAVGRDTLFDQGSTVIPRSARAEVAALAAAGRTPMLVAVDDTIRGVIAVADELRGDATALVTALHAAGVGRVVMLTGDDARVARSVADAVGIDEVHAGLLPEDKLAVVARLRDEGEVVAMVGDGVNDAPALATADLGVAMGAAGSDIAVETADVALMADNLLRLPDAIAIARATVANLRQNVAIALVTVGLLLAGVLFGGVTMAVGMLVHQASVLVVIANGMRLLRFVPPGHALHIDQSSGQPAATPDQAPTTLRTSTVEGTPSHGQQPPSHPAVGLP